MPTRSVVVRRATPRNEPTSPTLNFIALCRFAVLAGLLLLVSAGRCRAQSQQAAIDQLVEKSFSEIRKHQSVAVFNFVGPPDRVPILGRTLADDFSAKLAAEGGKRLVIERSAIDQAILANKLTAEIVRDPNVAAWLAESVHAKSIVFGRLSEAPHQLSIDIDLYGVEKRNLLKSFHATMDLTESMRADLNQRIQTSQPVSSRDAHASGSKGYTTPSCAYCPEAEYSEEGRKRRTQGTVLISVIVGPDEYAHEISVLKPLPDGLTENAIEAVKLWRFKPAVGPDGMPAAVKIAVEVSFHLY